MPNDRRVSMNELFDALLGPSTPEENSFISDLTYLNYQHNRQITPTTTPEQWATIYGPRTMEMEARYQREMHRDDAPDYGLERILAADERGDEDRESTEELPGH